MILTGRVISKKNSKRIFRLKNGRTISLPSTAFETFKTSYLWQLKRCIKHKGRVKIAFEFHLKGRMDQDIDNAVTSVLDILQEAEIIENDKLVMEIYARKEYGYKDFETIITIEKIKHIYDK